MKRSSRHRDFLTNTSSNKFIDYHIFRPTILTFNNVGGNSRLYYGIGAVMYWVIKLKSNNRLPDSHPYRPDIGWILAISGLSVLCRADIGPMLAIVTVRTDIADIGPISTGSINIILYIL